MANLVWICKKIWSNHPISRDIQLQNFHGRNPSNFWVKLVIWKINYIINSFWLYLTFSNRLSIFLSVLLVDTPNKVPTSTPSNHSSVGWKRKMENSWYRNFETTFRFPYSKKELHLLIIVVICFLYRAWSWILKKTNILK